MIRRVSNVETSVLAGLVGVSTIVAPVDPQNGSDENMSFGL